MSSIYFVKVFGSWCPITMMSLICLQIVTMALFFVHSLEENIKDIERLKKICKAFFVRMLRVDRGLSNYQGIWYDWTHSIRRHLFQQRRLFEFSSVFFEGQHSFETMNHSSVWCATFKLWQWLLPSKKICKGWYQYEINAIKPFLIASYLPNFFYRLVHCSLTFRWQIKSCYCTCFIPRKWKYLVKISHATVLWNIYGFCLQRPWYPERWNNGPRRTQLFLISGCQNPWIWWKSKETISKSDIACTRSNGMFASWIQSQIKRAERTC